MACSCDSCSSPRIIKTRTAMFWRWRAQSRGETADRVIPAPVPALVGRVSLPRGRTTEIAASRTGAEAIATVHSADA